MFALEFDLFLEFFNLLVTRSCNSDIYLQQIEAFYVHTTLFCTWFLTENINLPSSSTYFVMDLIGICYITELLSAKYIIVWRKCIRMFWSVGTVRDNASGDFWLICKNLNLIAISEFVVSDNDKTPSHIYLIS